MRNDSLVSIDVTGTVDNAKWYLTIFDRATERTATYPVTQDDLLRFRDRLNSLFEGR